MGENGMYRILVCDDERDIVSALRIYLTAEGYEVLEAYNGSEMLRLAATQEVHLILLDVMMPGMDGLSAMAELRRTSNVPVILLTAKSEDTDKVLGLNLGADDYVTKPFSPKVLLAKANALIKRASGSVCEKNGEISACGIVMNTISHTVFSGGEEITLTPKEYDLLYCLMANRGRVLSRDMLLERVWGFDYIGDDRTVDTHIKKLRTKLGDRASHIKTLIKAGDKFDENG